MPFFRLLILMSISPTTFLYFPQSHVVPVFIEWCLLHILQNGKSTSILVPSVINESNLIMAPCERALCFTCMLFSVMLRLAQCKIVYCRYNSKYSFTWLAFHSQRSFSTRISFASCDRFDFRNCILICIHLPISKCDCILCLTFLQIIDDIYPQDGSSP